MTTNLHTDWLAYMLDDVIRSGHTFSEVMAYDDYQWDTEHSFIQWLFPNKVPSRINLDAPVLTPIDLMVYRDNPDLQQRCMLAIARFLDFLGLRWTDNSVVRALNFKLNNRYWLCHSSHNHLRITRFMNFCVAIGRHDIAEALLFCLCKECHIMNTPPSTSIRYWQDAVFGIKDNT